MSDSAIGSGDLVYVVGNPLDLLCPHVQEHLGLPLRVGDVMFGNLVCEQCRLTWRESRIAVFDRNYPHALRLSWLKKFPPLVETESIAADEKVPA